MIIYDQLRISDDGDRVYINAHVNTASYFDNVYLGEIAIKAADKVLETSPDSFPTQDYVYHSTFDANLKEISLVLDKSNFDSCRLEDENAVEFKGNFTNTLLFVYIKVSDGSIPAANTPCDLDISTVLGVVFYEKAFYRRVMDYSKALADDCIISTGFTDFILLWNAFRASIETGHYIAAIDFFNKLFGNINTFGSRTIVKKCGCHG